MSTGDRYCEERGIETIDLLKIDVEGFEDRVLRGFSRMLGAGKVTAVQFEYGLANINTRFLLKDFHELLEGMGFVVGKVFPKYVDFRPYEIATDEDFKGPNFLAVHSRHATLIDVLAG